MSSELKISVVMPVYNCEKYIVRSIQSVMKQTYENWELIIVNDGSWDSSEKIAEGFVGKDPRIRLISQENQGVSVARNRGIEEASGELLMFLDADDWFEENAFKLAAANWDDSIQMLLFDYYDVPENGDKQYRKHFKKDRIEFGENRERSMNDLELTISGFYSEQNGTATVIEAPWGRVFKTDYVKQKNLKFPVGVFMCEDQVFNLRAIIEMSKVLYISRPIYNYYINADSVSGAISERCRERLIPNMTERNRYVKEIFFGEHNALYEDAYYHYVFEGVKVILWWLADETEKSKKVLGRNYCYTRALNIKKHMCREYGFTDKVLLSLCEKKCFSIVETIVRIRKRIKKMLNVR